MDTVTAAITIQERNKITVSEITSKLRSIAVASLAKMYRHQEHLFTFRLREKDQVEIL